jgi:hypothetical protein
MIISHSVLLRMRNTLDRSYRENQNTHLTFNKFFPKIMPLMNNVEKYGRAKQATEDNTIHHNALT